MLTVNGMILIQIVEDLIIFLFCKISCSIWFNNFAFSIVFLQMISLLEFLVIFFPFSVNWNVFNIWYFYFCFDFKYANHYEMLNKSTITVKCIKFIFVAHIYCGDTMYLYLSIYIGHEMWSILIIRVSHLKNKITTHIRSISFHFI